MFRILLQVLTCYKTLSSREFDTSPKEGFVTNLKRECLAWGYWGNIKIFNDQRLFFFILIYWGITYLSDTTFDRPQKYLLE